MRLSAGICHYVECLAFAFIGCKHVVCYQFLHNGPYYIHSDIKTFGNAFESTGMAFNKIGNLACRHTLLAVAPFLVPKKGGNDFDLAGQLSSYGLEALSGNSAYMFFCRWAYHRIELYAFQILKPPCCTYQSVHIGVTIIHACSQENFKPDSSPVFMTKGLNPLIE